MMILGLDVGSDGCSAALADGDHLLAQAIAPVERGSPEPLIGVIDSLLQKNQIDLDRIQQIAVTVGPGSFTGIRVGLAVAQGLALSTSKKLFGVPRLGAIAAQVPATERAERNILVVESSGKGDWHIAAYDSHLQTLIAPCVQKPNEPWPRLPESLVICGNGAEDAARNFSSATIDIIENTQTMAVANVRFAYANRDCVHLYPATPLYLRDADVTLASAG